MPRYIVHHDGLFFEFSTVVDAPVTCALTKDEFIEYYKMQYGENYQVGSNTSLENRLERAIICE